MHHFGTWANVLTFILMCLVLEWFGSGIQRDEKQKSIKIYLRNKTDQDLFSYCLRGLDVNLTLRFCPSEYLWAPCIKWGRRNRMVLFSVILLRSDFFVWSAHMCVSICISFQILLFTSLPPLPTIPDSRSLSLSPAPPPPQVPLIQLESCCQSPNTQA